MGGPDRIDMITEEIPIEFRLTATTTPLAAKMRRMLVRATGPQRVLVSLMDDTQLFKEYTGNEGFRNG